MNVDREPHDSNGAQDDHEGDQLQIGRVPVLIIVEVRKILDDRRNVQEDVFR